MTMPHWRHKQKQKRRREPAELLREREARRTAALAQCVREMSTGEGTRGVTHTLVAERVGVPVQFVRWKYPSVEHLLAMAEA
jgi:DNA-binding transcriptional regulator YbjK